MKEIPSTLADGIYTLTSVYLMDSVGNAAYAEVASGNRLVVDKTPPVIENIVVHGGDPSVPRTIFSKQPGYNSVFVDFEVVNPFAEITVTLNNKQMDLCIR